MKKVILLMFALFSFSFGVEVPKEKTFDNKKYEEEFEKNGEGLTPKLSVAFRRSLVSRDNNPKEKRELEKVIIDVIDRMDSYLCNIVLDKNAEPYIDFTRPNVKKMNQRGEEIVFNKKTGLKVQDDMNDGTYNVAGDDYIDGKKMYKTKDVFYHLDIDFQQWILYGVSQKDKLTEEQRGNLYEVALSLSVNNEFENYLLKNGKLATFKNLQEFKKERY